MFVIFLGSRKLEQTKVCVAGEGIDKMCWIYAMGCWQHREATVSEHAQRGGAASSFGEDGHAR